MDFMTPEGFSHAMFQVLRLKPGASMTLAPVCSSWVWVNLGMYYHALATLVGLILVTSGGYNMNYGFKPLS